jgi:hypothetical protein
MPTFLLPHLSAPAICRRYTEAARIDDFCPLVARLRKRSNAVIDNFAPIGNGFLTDGLS